MTIVYPLYTTTQIADRSSTVLGTSSISVLAANLIRRGVTFFNPTAVNIGISPSGVTAAIGSTGTIVLIPNGAYITDPDIVYTGAYNAIAASGSNNVLVIWEY